MLAGHPGVLHVRVIAPKDNRVEYVAQAGRISVAAAIARVEASDRARVDFVRRYYGVYRKTPRCTTSC